MGERDKFAPVIEGFDCSGITDPYSYRCEPFYVDGENAGTLLDGSTVHDVLASKIRLSWNLTVLAPERYAALVAALEGADILDTVNALVYDATADAVRLASFHVTRPACRAVNNFGATHIIPQSALVLEEATPIARFRVTPPDKLSYSIGETLDLSGLTVTAYDKDGAASDITAQCAVTPADGTPLLNPGTVALSVSYNGLPLYAAAATVTDAEIIASGDWWTLYSNGFLEIFCEGDMPSIEWEAGDGYIQPWRNYRSQILSARLSDSVTSIAGGAFSGCAELVSVAIPDSVTSIGGHAFGGCNNLLNVNIPDSVTTIGEYAFSGCISLESIIIPSGVKEIETSAFSSCNSFKSVTIPGNVSYIKSSAFWGCSALRSVTLSRGVKFIYENAFRNTRNLQFVAIPKSLTGIANYAFWFDSSGYRKEFYYEGTEADWANVYVGPNQSGYTVHYESYDDMPTEDDV